MSETGRSPTLIGSVQRALRLLDTVATSRGPVTAKRLARLVGLPLPTTYHLLRTLVHEGYLHKLSEGYVLGERVPAIQKPGTAHTAVIRVRPALQRLRDELSGAAYLALFDDGEIVLMDVAEGPATPRVDEWVDFNDAGHATALGKSLLSCLDENLRRDYLERHPLLDLTPRTITDRRILLRTLPRAGQIAIEREEFSLDTACVAVPVRTARMVGAIAVSVPVRRLASVIRGRNRLHEAAGSAARALALP